MKPFRMPTEAELNAIPVTEDDELELLGQIAAIEKAFDRARIPTTLEWQFLTLMYTSQAAVLSNMPCEYFAAAADASYRAAIAEVAGQPREFVTAMPALNLGEVVPKYRRLQSALDGAKWKTRKPRMGEMALVLLNVVGKPMARLRLPLDLFVATAVGCYEAGEQNVHHLAAKQGGKA